VCQHTATAVPIRTRWRHQRGKALYQLQRREVQFGGLSAALGTALVSLIWVIIARLAVLLLGQNGPAQAPWRNPG